MKWIPFIIWLLLLHSVNAQPGCGASLLQMQIYEHSPSGGTRVVLSVNAIDGVQNYTIRYRFRVGNEIMENLLPLTDLQTALTLNPNATWHEFTALNSCEDGTIAEGSTIYLDLINANLDCPAPTNLVIEFANSNSAGFRWDVNTSASGYRVDYTPDAGATQTNEIPVPSFMQQLATATVHNFALYNICETPGIINNAKTYSPALRFSIVTVDDIKGFRIKCADLIPLVDTAYIVQCTKHGDFGPNKDSFLLVHQGDCLTAVHEPKLTQISVAPNPSSNELMIHFYLEKPDILEGTLMNSQGRTAQRWLPVQRLSAGEHRYPIELSKVPPGIYILNIKTSTQLFTKKIIKLP